MKLEKYIKNKKQKKILITSIIVFILLIGGTLLYKTFALYEEKETFDVLNGVVPKFSKNKLFSKYIISLADQKDENLEKVEHDATDQTGDKAKIDYRYTGSNPDNYVYFGCEDNCTEDNLYRVIGVMPTQKEIDGAYENRVKLIKASFYTESESHLLGNASYYSPTVGGYNWTSLSNLDNRWETSDLNTKVLNDVYWNSLGADYQNYIEPSVWYLGALSSIENYKGEGLYKTERSNSLPLYTGGVHSISTNIGLMYPSDLAYSMSKEYWSELVKTGTATASSNVKNSWLFGFSDSTGYEWFITPEATSSNYNGYFAWTYSQGLAFAGAVIKWHDHYFGIRPSFYLKANVLFQNGNGSKDNPYRISISKN